MRYRLRKVLLWIKSVPRILRNLRDWFPILAKDYPWDYYYLLAIMKKKIELMRAYLEECEIGYEGMGETIQQFKEAERACELLMNGGEPLEKQRESLKNLTDNLRENLLTWWA